MKKKKFQPMVVAATPATVATRTGSTTSGSIWWGHGLAKEAQ